MAPACSKDAYALDDVFRKAARLFPEVTDWLCPISGLLMKDPVTAVDGFNYERSAITDWFTKVGKVSPQTKKEMEDELETNYDLAQAVAAFKIFVNGTAESLNLTWKHHGSCAGQIRNVTLSRDDVLQGQALEGEKVQMCQALSKFFKELDPIEDLLRRMLNGLRPPKIVVVGDESAGKSTILEMASMSAFFPRKRRCCTRMAIHVRMRRTPGVSRATLSVLSADGQVELVREIPQENGWLIVEEEMERLQKELFGSDRKEERIISQKILVVQVERPDVPCLDLVDLPGLAQWPKEKAEEIRKIYQRQVKDDRESGNQCMYLAVVKASGEPRPDGTSVMPFIMEEGLQDRTFGIFSKCDENSDADVLRALTLHEKTDQDETPESLGAVHLSKGWVTTMLKPPNGEHFKYHSYERMYLQLKQEMEWFQKPDLPERKAHWPRLVENHSAGITDLVPRVQQLYLHHLQIVWKGRPDWAKKQGISCEEYAMLQILEKEATTQFQLNMLGVVQDEGEKQRLAKEEVARRLGPNSEVTWQMYNSFVAEVLHRTLVAEVDGILEDFNGKPCPGHAVSQHLKELKERFLCLMQEIVLRLENRMVDAVRDILLAESELCSDGPGDFNVRTASLRRYSTGCTSKWEVQEKLKDEPIIQLCHYEDYINAIMEKYSHMLRERKESLQESLEKLIRRIADVDFASPYLQVDSSFLSQSSEINYADSGVKIHCDREKILNAFLHRCYQHVPHPDQLKDLYQDVAVGCETRKARMAFDGLRKELGLVKTAKESIIRALSIEDEDLGAITRKFKEEQLAGTGQPVAVVPEGSPFPPQGEGSAVQTVPHLADTVTDADVADVANVVTPSGGSWDLVTSQSTPTSEDAQNTSQGQLFDFDHLDKKDDESEECKAHEWQVGDMVELHSLIAANLNGQAGKVIEVRPISDSGEERLRVLLPNRAEPVAIKTSNLRFLYHQAEDTAPMTTGGDGLVEPTEAEVTVAHQIASDLLKLKQKKAKNGSRKS